MKINKIKPVESYVVIRDAFEQIYYETYSYCNFFFKEVVYQMATPYVFTKNVSFICSFAYNTSTKCFFALKCDPDVQFHKLWIWYDVSANQELAFIDLGKLDLE